MNSSSKDLNQAHVREESNPKKGDDNGSGSIWKDATIGENIDDKGDQSLHEPLALGSTLDNMFFKRDVLDILPFLLLLVLILIASVSFCSLLLLSYLI